MAIDTKVVLVDDLDNTTVRLNNGKVEAVQPTAEQVNQYIQQNLEIVEQISNFHDSWGNWIDSPFGIRIDGVQHRIDQVGRIKGTNWLVFGSSTMG